MAIPTSGAMIAAIGSPAEWAAVSTEKLAWNDVNSVLSTITVHATTLLTDHIGEHTGSHGIVFDNPISTANDLTFTVGRKGAVGVYDATNTQAIWAMGPAYVLSGAAPSPYGPAYGLFWSYNPDYGGAGNNPQSKAGLSHQLLVMHSGVTQSAIGLGIWTVGDIYSAGMYTGVTGSGYGSLRISGAANGFAGIELQDCQPHSSAYRTIVGMYDTAGNGGDWDSYNGWHYYWNHTNCALALAGSTTYSDAPGACVNGVLIVTGVPYTIGAILYWTQWSDERLKSNIKSVSGKSSLDKILQLRPVSYNYNEKYAELVDSGKKPLIEGQSEVASNAVIADTAKEHIGFLAQELQQVFPEMVSGRNWKDKDGVSTHYLDSNLTGLETHLVNAVQELSGMISTQTKTTEDILTRLEKLDKKSFADPNAWK